jgi:hypothetical protein
MNARLTLCRGALAVAMAFFSPLRAQADPGQPDPNIEIRERIALVTPGALVVDVDASCAPWSGSRGTVDVIVEQPIPASTSANEGEGIMSIPCDGMKHRIGVTVTGGPFQAGAANVYAQVTAGTLPAMTANDARKATIGR